MTASVLETKYIDFVARDQGVKATLDQIVRQAEAVAQRLETAFDKVGGGPLNLPRPPSPRPYTELEQTIVKLKNTSAAYRSELESGSAGIQEQTGNLQRLKAEALRLADTLAIGSKEYRDLTGVAAQASRTLKTLSGDQTMLGLSGNVAIGTNQRLTRSLTDLHAAAGALLGGAGFAGMARSIAAMARDAERAQVQLSLFNRQLAKSGTDGAEGEQAIQRIADRLGILREEAAEGATLLLRYGANVEQIEQILIAGGASALAFGRNAAEGVEAIANAIISEQSALLNNIGIAGNLSTAYRRLAQSLGVSVESLTNQQKVLAVVNTLLRETEGEVESLDVLLGGLAGKNNELRRSWIELRNTLGDALNPLVTQLVGNLAQVLGIVSQLPPSVLRAGTAFTTAALGVGSLTTAFTLLKAVLGPLLGPAGWIVLGAGVVAALVAVLAGGKRNDLEGAAKEAAAAIGSASDKNALHGALVEFSNYLDGEAKTKVQGYAEAIRTATGDLNALKGEALAASKDALRSQLLLEREDILHRLKTLPRGATPDLFDVEPQLRMLEERFARTGVVVDLTWDAATRTIKGVGDNVVLAGNAQLDVLESLYQVQQQLRGNASEIVGDLNQQLADVDTRLSRLDSLFAPTPTNPDPERPPVGTQKTTEDPTLKWVQQVQAAFDLLSDKLRASKLELGDYLDQSGVLLDRLANEYQYVQNEAAAGNIPANLANQRAAAILAASNKITDALRRAREDAVQAAMEASSAVATVAAIPDDLPTVLDIPLDVRYAVEEGDAARLQEFIERELFGNRPFGLAAIPDGPLPVHIPLDVRYAIENDLELNDRLLAMLFGRGPATIVSIPDDPLPVEIPLDVRYAVESGDAAALERLITEQLSGPLRAIPRPRPLIEVGAAGLEMGRNLRAAGTELERVRALYDLGEVSATDLTDAMQRYRTALEAVIAFEGGAANASLVWLQALRAIREELDPLTDLTKRTGQALDQARARLKATGDYEAYLAEQSSILENAYVTLATSGFDGAAEAAERYLGQLKAVQAEQAALKQSAETLKGLQGIVKGFLEGVQLRFGVAQELTQIEALGQAFGKTFNVAEAKARAYQAIIEKLVRANPDAVGTASPAGLEIQVWVNRWQEAQREAAGQFGDALKALKVGEALASGFISIVRAAQSGDAAGVVGGAFGMAAEVANLFGPTGQFVSQVLGVAGGIISGIVDLATRQAREAAAKARRDAEFSYELAGVSNDANARTRESKNETARISNAIGQLEYLRKRAQNDILAVNSDALARTIELRNKAIELGIPQEQIKWALDAIERAAQAEIDEIKARLKDELKGYLGVSAADIRGMLETAFTDLETRPLGESLKSTILEAARTALIRSFNDSQVFREFQGRIGDLIETYVSDGRLSPAELDAIIKEVEKFEESTKTHQEAIEAVNRRLEEMGYTVDRVTSQLSNVPSGFKVALERFAALDAMPATGGAVIRPQSIAATTTYLPSARERGGSTLQVSGNTFVLPNVTDAESLLRELRRLEEQSAVAQTGSPVGAI